MQDVCGSPVLCCCSQEALESFNRGLAGFVTAREKSIPWFRDALEKDGDFVLAHSMMAFFMLFDLTPPSDPKVAKHLVALKGVAEDGQLHERERAYVRFVQEYASGDLATAFQSLVSMLTDYPHDALALRMLHVTLLFMSEFERLRDVLAWVLSFWTKDTPFYTHIMAIYAFTVEECNEREKAEKILRRLLDQDSDTPLAYHAMSHVLEESKQPSDGIEFLTGSRSLWSVSIYGNHITWHLTLYYLDLGDTDTVLKEFDAVMHDKATPDNYLGLIDAASLLWRLDVAGVDPGEDRWKKVTDAMATRAHNHRMPWFSAHVMMSLARGRVSEDTARLALAEGMLKSMEEYCTDEGAFNQPKCKQLGLPVCTALLAFGKGNYDEVLQIMLPLRHDLRSVGGSWAQRQIFNSTIIEAALRTQNIPVAMGLVAELLSRKPQNRRLRDLLLSLQERHRDSQTAPKKIKK